MECNNSHNKYKKIRQACIHVYINPSFLFHKQISTQKEGIRIIKLQDIINQNYGRRLT